MEAELFCVGYDPDIIGYCWDDSNPRIQLDLVAMWVHRAQSGQTEIRMSRAVPKMYRP